MKEKNWSYYKKAASKKLASSFGVLTIISTIFAAGFAVGCYYQSALSAKDSVKEMNEFSLKLIECENEKLKEVFTIREEYNNRINELKQELYEIKNIKDDK